MNVKALQPGIELDSLIEEYVYNHTPVRSAKEEDDDYTCLPRYSTEMSPAWGALEKVIKDPYRYMRMDWGNFTGDGAEYVVRINNNIYGNGSTAPLAICRALLDLLINNSENV